MMRMVMTIIYVVVWTVTRNSPYSSNNNMNIENGKKCWICDREFSADGIAYGTATIYLDDQWHMKCEACSQYVRSRKILGVINVRGALMVDDYAPKSDCYHVNQSCQHVHPAVQGDVRADVCKGMWWHSSCSSDQASHSAGSVKVSGFPDGDWKYEYF